MYLAIRWLTILSIAMWGFLCIIDRKLKCEDVRSLSGRHQHSHNTVPVHTNTSSMRVRVKTRKLKHNTGPRPVSYINYLTFIAGAFVVMVYNKRNEIMSLAKTIVAKINFRLIIVKAVIILYKVAEYLKAQKPPQLGPAVREILSIKCDYLKQKSIAFLTYLSMFCNDNSVRNERSRLLLKRLRDVVQERNKIAQLLVTTMQENKNCKMQWQMEHVAKTRLMQQIQETQNQIKDNRSRYMNFQQLYLVTHQENMFLKSRIKKLYLEKNEAEANLMKLVNKIYRCSDNNLKAYCTCFVMKTKDKVATENVNQEIRNLKQKHRSYSLDATTSSKSLTNVHLAEVLKEGLVEVVSDDARSCLREYVWTVKDKDGLIEKLYEYDYGFDNGDNIRRIREYSVYHDKDCLLDLANSSSTTIIHDRSGSESQTSSRTNLPKSRRFLTESPAFQQFLRGTLGITSRSHNPVLCS